MNAIELTEVVRTFGVGPSSVRALTGVTLRIPRGEVFGLVGPDGAGKTTLLRLLAGLQDRTSGELRVLEVDPSAPDASHLRERLGLVPQEHSLYGDLSVDENLNFYGELFGLAPATFRARRERLLGITRLAPFVERRAAQLSGGMYKKLALACALLHEPAVLLLDEPTNGVDPVSRRELWELVDEFAAAGMTIVVATPTMDESVRCHRVALLDRGAILRVGPPRDLARAFDGLVFELAGNDLEALHTALDPMGAALLARSPAGERLRVVLEAEGEARLRSLLGSVPLARVEPSFEDLFLAEVARARLRRGHA